jgi:hypothetical protein
MAALGELAGESRNESLEPIELGGELVEVTGVVERPCPASRNLAGP